MTMILLKFDGTSVAVQDERSVAALGARLP
jgi:hypothetical protein